ncbi:hypothetical protein H6761_00975 [Candidatus Nomurabacteria bacterium]|nr:hypothetical protein [Candidatus Nomurabacteria bacterium]
MISLRRKQHLALQGLSIAIIIGNLFYLHWPILGIFVGLFYLSLNSKKIGDLFFFKIKNSFKNTLGLLTILSYLSLVYTLFYHVYQINTLTFLFSLISITSIVEFVSWKKGAQHYFFSNLDLPSIRLANIKNIILPGIFILTEILTFILIFRKASSEIIRSPWELLGLKFWILFVFLSAILIIYLIKSKSNNTALFLISCYFFLISSLALIIYHLGFGYDPFLHQAAMKVIEETGTIKPRLFFYLGQYAWTFWFHDLWQIDLATINKLIMPLAFSILWPKSLFYGLKYGFKWPSRISLIFVLLSLFLGFNFAIMTTPQNLAFLLIAIFIFLLPIIKKDKTNLSLSLIFGLAISTIHPLGGIPVIYFSVLYLSQTLPLKKSFKKILFTLIFILSGLSLPILLIIYQKLNQQTWQQIITWKPWPLFELPKFVFYHDFNFPLDLIHNIGQNRTYIFIVLVIFSWILIVKKHKYLFFNKHLVLLIILLINYLLARIFISFNKQIDYEQNAYLLRIIYLMALVLLPIFLTAWYFWWEKYLQKSRLSIYKLWIICLSIIILASATYFSYPLYDRHLNSKSFNISQDDLETVHLIEESAQGEAYIVLANQMVGAAAINTFGFKNYYQGNFFYSMPLGSDNIYRNFIQMIENKASKEEANLAMDKAGVDKLYFVVNNYWHSAKTAIEQAKDSADNYFLVGKNQIFVYQR